jgi:hypothetical protein
MLDSGIVVGVRDRSGATGFAALDRPGLRLLHRVASLMVVDHLTRFRSEAPGPQSGIIVKVADADASLPDPVLLAATRG